MARILSLKPGSRVFCGTIEYEILAPASLTSVKVRNVINGEVRVLLTEELSSQSTDEAKQLSTPLDCLSDEEKKIAIKRFNVIKPAILRNLSRKEMEELANKHSVHYTTIYRMVKKYRETMSPASLIPRIKNRGGKGKHRIVQAVEDVIKIHFEAIYRAKEVDITKLKVKALQKQIKAKCTALKLRPPTWYTVNERLEQFIQDKKLNKKRKSKGGRSRTMAGRSFPDANWPLDYVQIDHTPLDIILVDDESREPIGKPYLSIAIDVYSRMVVGFSISLDPPCIFSVGKLIGNCILPKKSFLEEVGVDSSWDIFGMMGTLHMDNAGEFRSEDFIPFQEEYMVEVRWRPVATPEYGGHIERLAKTLNDIVHGEPGSTMGNIIKREGYDSEGKACYTIDEIEKWLTILITKIYHLEKHSSLRNSRGEKISPLEKYMIGIFGDENTQGIGIPDVVEDPIRLKTFLLPTCYRTVQREGIEIDSIKYYHDILRTLYGKKGEDGKPKKYLIKQDPRRLTPIYIFDPDRREYFEIPYRDLTRPPITIWDLKASKKRCNEKGINNPNEQQIFDAYAELRQIRDQATKTTKKVRREREAKKRRSKDQPVHSQKNAKSVNAPEPVISNAEDVVSFYDDPNLLNGVTVNNKGGES